MQDCPNPLKFDLADGLTDSKAVLLADSCRASFPFCFMINRLNNSSTWEQTSFKPEVATQPLQAATLLCQRNTTWWMVTLPGIRDAVKQRKNLTWSLLPHSTAAHGSESAVTFSFQTNLEATSAGPASRCKKGNQNFSQCHVKSSPKEGSWEAPPPEHPVLSL